MSRVTQEQIEQARQVGILAYMRANEPDELIKVGSTEYRTRTHDSLRISENGKWHWCSRGFGGTNALNYLIRVKGIDFVSAVRYLCDDEPTLLAQSIEKTQPKKKRGPIVFSAPKPDTSNAVALRYLRRRGICNQVLSYCVEQQILYQTNHKGHTNCVFIGKDENGIAKYACVRGCVGDFRGDIGGSLKQYAFSIPASDPDASIVEAYEAPIDALSGATLRAMHRREWRSVHYLAMGGLNYLALEYFLDKNPKVRSIRLCLDNDKRGREFADNLVKLYTERGLSVVNLVPPKGKDVNEYLQIKLGMRKEQER